MQIVGLILMLAAGRLAAAEPGNGCMSCHAALADSTLSAPARGFRGDEHTRWRVTCNDCHGGNPDATTKQAAKGPGTGYLGKPRPQDIPARCGRCHSDAERMHKVNPTLRVDQEAQYRTSVHGIQLANGDTKVATCKSCHGVHGMLAVKDPRSPVNKRNIVATCMKCHADPKYMAGYTIPNPDGSGEIPLPTDQGERYMRSVHAEALYKKGDISAPTCTSCHGNHGATPPEISSVSAVCRQCHVTQADIFDDSPHKDAFFDAEYPDCTSCHGNHEITGPSDAMIGDGSDAVCQKCHSEGDDPLEVAANIRRLLDTLTAAVASADTVLATAEIKGMDADEGRLVLREATNGLIQSRNFVHSVRVDEVESLYRPAMAKTHEATVIGEGLLHEVSVRRGGLAVSLLLIALLAVALIVKIRDLDRRNPPQ